MNYWPLLIILAVGIAIGRWIEIRRRKRVADTLAKTNAAIQALVDKALADKDPEDCCPVNDLHSTYRTWEGGLWCEACRCIVRACL